MINSTSTEDSSFSKCYENKQTIGECELEEDKRLIKIISEKNTSIKEESVSKKYDSKFSNCITQCYIRDIFEKYGSLYIYDRNNTNIYISKLRIVNFPMKKLIFERGKINSPKFYNIEYSSIPDMKFWNQRYYYYSKFDEGIKMDYESK
jgi:hypothetical protein